MNIYFTVCWPDLCLCCFGCLCPFSFYVAISAETQIEAIWNEQSMKMIGSGHWCETVLSHLAIIIYFWCNIFGDYLCFICFFGFCAVILLNVLLDSMTYFLVPFSFRYIVYVFMEILYS